MEVTYSYDTTGGFGGAQFGVFMFFYFALLLVMVASLWRVFAKAGKPGWAAIVPIYNVIVLLEIVGRPIWWLVLYLIPVVNFVIAIIITFDLAKAFGQSSGFGLGLLLLPIVFYPILAFGGSSYAGPVATAQGAY
jgi:hypothetical protein